MLSRSRTVPRYELLAEGEIGEETDDAGEAQVALARIESILGSASGSGQGADSDAWRAKKGRMWNKLRRPRH